MILISKRVAENYEYEYEEVSEYDIEFKHEDEVNFRPFA